MIISIAYTASQNGVIRDKNTLPWDNVKRLRCDHFIKAPKSRLLIVGRLSFEALEIELECDFVVLSTSKNSLENDNVRYVSSLEEAINFGRAGGFKEVVISGGRELLTQAMQIADVVYKSTILVEPVGNVYAPTIPSQFHLIWVKNINGYPSHSHQTYTKKDYQNAKLDEVGLLRL